MKSLCVGRHVFLFQYRYISKALPTVSIIPIVSKAFLNIKIIFFNKKGRIVGQHLQTLIGRLNNYYTLIEINIEN